jgi:predicted dehydrogenase
MSTFKDGTLNIGVVGLGKMGLLHASIANTLPNVRVAAFCDKSWFMRKIAKKALKAPLVTDDLEKFSGLDLDAIYVTTPIPSHYSIIKTVYSKNLAPNVFVEKTLTKTASQSEEVCAMLDTVKGNTMVGYMKRFCVTFKKAKELLDDNILGDLKSFDAHAFSSDFAEVEEGSTLSLARGGCLLDIGSHISDISLWLFGDLTVVSSKLQKSLTQGSIDSIGYQVEGPDGLNGNFTVSWVEKGYRMPEFGLTIQGTKGSLTVDDYELKLSLHDAEPTKYYRQNLGDSVNFALGESEYFREDQYFIDSIKSGAISEPSFKTAMKVDVLLESARCKANA